MSKWKIEELFDDDIGVCDKCHKEITDKLYTKNRKDYICEACMAREELKNE